MFIEKITRDSGLPATKIENVLKLLEEGNTIPFIARYRKEITGNLDEVQLRQIESLFTYMTELEERRQSILKSLETAGKLTPDLKSKILRVEEKQALEDIYLPFKPKRKTRAVIAREKGLEPLSEKILAEEDYSQWLEEFLKSEQGKDLSNENALQGASDIIAEKFSEDAELLQALRTLNWKKAVLVSAVKDEFKEAETKFQDYYDFHEPVSDVAAHRLLAIRRGEKEKVLKMRIDFAEEESLQKLCALRIPQGHKYENFLKTSGEDALKRLITPSMELHFRGEMRKRADEESIRIFQKNLRNLLMAPYGGEKITLGIDPGYRTGCKWSVIDRNGNLQEYGVIYLLSAKEIEKSKAEILRVLKKYGVEFVCVGNGTASKEAMDFTRKLLADSGNENVIPIMVNEAGASVYSASETARKEFPDLDLTARSAISIARRFQDPLAELVKIDPKSIGVGQYQHDVNQTALKEMLAVTTESCVNQVGVNLNTASAELLSYVSGINSGLAESIVRKRAELKGFQSRETLKSVPGLGEKTFHQCAGFLRIPDSDYFPDRTAVHPESYAFLEGLAKKLETEISELANQLSLPENASLQKAEAAKIGEFTFQDILEELKKPGRDPRKEFSPVRFHDEITDIKHLEAGMKLEGVITNVTQFGAFIDIGVHRDGFVHISEVADHYVKDITKICQVAQKVRVKVLSVDLKRNRIAMSMKSDNPTPQKKKKSKPKPAASLESLQKKFDRLNCR